MDSILIYQAANDLVQSIGTNTYIVLNSNCIKVRIEFP